MSISKYPPSKKNVKTWKPSRFHTTHTLWPLLAQFRPVNCSKLFFSSIDRFLNCSLLVFFHFLFQSIFVSFPPLSPSRIHFLFVFKDKYSHSYCCWRSPTTRNHVMPSTRQNGRTDRRVIKLESRRIGSDLSLSYQTLFHVIHFYQYHPAHLFELFRLTEILDEKIFFSKSENFFFIFLI